MFSLDDGLRTAALSDYVDRWVNGRSGGRDGALTFNLLAEQQSFPNEKRTTVLKCTEYWYPPRFSSRRVG
jgi:hypothetical protein